MTRGVQGAREARLPAPEDVAAGGVSVAARGVEEEISKVAPLDVLLLRGNVREMQLRLKKKQRGGWRQGSGGARTGAEEMGSGG